MAGRVAFDVDANRPPRHAIEVRHESFRDAAFLESLEKHDVAVAVVVVAGTAGRYPKIDAWAATIKAWSRQRLDVYAHFDNDAKVHSPFDASALAHRFGLNDAAVKPTVDLEGIDDAPRATMPPIGAWRRPRAAARIRDASGARMIRPK